MKALKGTFKTLLIAIIIAVPLKFFVFRTFDVQGASMETEIRARDRLIVEEISYRLKRPARGDIVVFRSPNDNREFFVKRVIGLPNEKIQLTNGQITIFNEAQPAGFILDENNYLSADQVTLGSMTLSLGPAEYFVLGDNRKSSSDSRFWGPIDRSLIEGRVMSRAWPINQFTIFQKPTY